MATQIKKVRPEEVLTLPMAPLLDVVMQILCFFVITYEMDKPEVHLVVNLPDPSIGKPDKNLDLLDFQIYPNQYMHKENPLTLEAVEEFLKGISDTQTMVIVKVSQKAKAEQVIRLLDLCQKMKFTNFSLMTMKTEASG